MNLARNGEFLLDRAGKPCRLDANGQVIDSANKPVLNLSGKPITISATATQLSIRIKKENVLGPDGKAIRVALNGQIFDSNANPILTSAGAPIYIDGKKKTLVDIAGKPIKIGEGKKANQIEGKIGKTTLATA